MHVSSTAILAAVKLEILKRESQHRGGRIRGNDNDDDDDSVFAAGECNRQLLQWLSVHHWLQVLILLSYTVINDTIQNSFLNLAPQQKLIALIGFSDIFDTVNGANYLSFTAVDFLKISIMVSTFF